MGGGRVLINALSWTSGGGNTYALNLIRELRRDSRGFRFTLLIPHGRLASDEADGLEIAPVRFPERGQRLWRVLYEEARLPARARRFDLFYCLADLAPIWGTTPTVVAVRNLHIYDRSAYDTLRLRLLGSLVHKGLRRARRVVFPSRAAAELISPRARIPADRVAIVPHGVSPELFDPHTAPAAQGAPYVFMAASIERHKNMGVVVESLLHLGDRKLELWIAGADTLDPGYAAELRRLAERLGLGPRVRLLGPIPYREILSYYRGAVALVFPSLLETFGHPLLEAMLAGTPVVASDLPAFREIAGDIPIYFDPRDPVGIAKAIERIRGHEQETRLRVERGRALVERFSWRNSVDRLCGVFEDALRVG